MNIYVGNLAHAMSEQELREVFAEFGNVTSAKIIMDRFSGKSRGFGFVEMESADDGKKAMDSLNGKEVMGRVLKVNEAIEKKKTFNQDRY